MGSTGNYNSVDRGNLATQLSDKIRYIESDSNNTKTTELQRDLSNLMNKVAGSDEFWNGDKQLQVNAEITPSLRGFAINNSSIMEVVETLGLSHINIHNIDKLVNKFLNL